MSDGELSSPFLLCPSHLLADRPVLLGTGWLIPFLPPGQTSGLGQEGGDTHPSAVLKPSTAGGSGGSAARVCPTAAGLQPWSGGAAGAGFFVGCRVTGSH